MAIIFFSSVNVESYLRPLFSWEAEEVWIVGLSSSKTVLETRLLFRGTIDSCGIHSRDIFRFCCLTNASSFVLAHNHPTGEAAPSKMDEELTRRLRRLGIMMGIPMTDHLILSKEHYFSFADACFWNALKKRRRRS